MLDITDRDPYLWNILKSCFPKFRDFLFIHRRPRTTWFYTWNISRNLYIYIFERIYSFRTEFNSVKICSYWISFSPKAIYKKEKSPKRSTISPFSRKIRKEETENLLLLLFFPPLSNFFFQSCRNLNKPSPPSLLVFKRTDKEQEFLKNSRPHRAISLLFRIIVICANTFANTCIPLLEDKKTWGDKKTSVESENYSHAFLSSPSYLHCYLKKINSWSKGGGGESSIFVQRGDERFRSRWNLEWKERKKKGKKEKMIGEKLCPRLESSVIFLLIEFTASERQFFNETLAFFSNFVQFSSRIS